MVSMKNRSKIAALMIVVLFAGWLWNRKIQTPQPVRELQGKSKTEIFPKLVEPAVFNPAVNEPLAHIDTRKHPLTAAENIEIARKISILDEIFISKNDNDPRLDTQFKDLTGAEKEALHEKYKSTRLENRNERGTLVFLLGQNLESPQDFDFLKKVVSETRCNNLLNCSAGPYHPNDHEEGSGEIEVTLEYPQIVALKALEAYLVNHPRTPSITEILNEAMNSKNPITSRLAQSLNQKYKE